MTEQEEKQAIKEVLFDYNAETIEFADEIADRILRKLNELRKSDKELLEALKDAQTLMSENLPSIRQMRSYKLAEFLDSEGFTPEVYEAKAVEIHNENKYAYNLLEKINEAISNYEKQIK